MALLTYEKYAQHRKALGLSGTTAQAVEKAIRSGRITPLPGGIDAAVADIQWEANTRKRADLHANAPSNQRQAEPVSDSPSTGGDGIARWDESKAREQAAKAERAEIELAQLKGELVNRAGVERAAFAFGRILQKTLIDVFPSKISMEAVALADPWQFECFLRDKLRAELAAVSSLPSDEVEKESQTA